MIHYREGMVRRIHYREGILRMIRYDDIADIKL